MDRQDKQTQQKQKARNTINADHTDKAKGTALSV